MQKLRDYIKKNGLRKDFFAAKVGVSGATLSSWLKGITHPKIRLAIQVERATNGYVKVRDWLTEEAISDKTKDKNTEKS